MRQPQRFGTHPMSQLLRFVLFLVGGPSWPVKSSLQAKYPYQLNNISNVCPFCFRCDGSQHVPPPIFGVRAMSGETFENCSNPFGRAEQPPMFASQRTIALAPENSYPMCICYYPESGGCQRYAVVNEKYCVYCLDEKTNWACRCTCVGCPTSHEAAVATKVASPNADADADADADAASDADAVSFEAVMEEVQEPHCLIALFLGPDDGFDGHMQFPEVYMLRHTARRVRQISYYEVHWLRAWCWLCGCAGQFEHGAGCSMEWRQQAWICPVVFRCL